MQEIKYYLSSNKHHVTPDAPYITTAANHTKITLTYGELPSQPKDKRDQPPKEIKFSVGDTDDPKLPKHRQ